MQTIEPNPLTKIVVACVLAAIAHPAGSAETRTNSATTIDIARAAALRAQLRPLCAKEHLDDLPPHANRSQTRASTIDSLLELTRLAIETAQNTLAEGKSAEAAAAICTVIRMRAEQLGMLDPRTLAGVNNLAVILRKQGQLAEARGLIEELLPIVRTYPPPGAQVARAVISNLATTLHQQGYKNQAEALYRECIANAERLQQVSARTISSTLSNLGLLLDEQGRHSEAEAMHRRALALRSQEYGVDHIETSASLNNLGANLTAQGNLTEGEQLLRRGLEGRRQQLGEEHLNVAFSMDRLSRNLLEQGRQREAQELSSKVLSIRREQLGDRHPDTAAAFYQLSRAELALGQSLQALAHARAALASRLPDSQREEATLNADRREYIRQSTSSAAFQLVRAAWDVAGKRPQRVRVASAVIEEAFAATQRIPLSDTADAILRASARNTARGAGLAALIRQLESAEDRLTMLDQTLASAAAQAPAGAAFTELKAQQAKLADEVNSVQDRLRSNSSAFFELVRTDPITLVDVMGSGGKVALIGADEAVLLVTPGFGREHGFVWAVSREEIAWVEIPVPAEQLKRSIERLRGMLDIPGRGTRPITPLAGWRPAYDLQEARALYQQLFGSTEVQHVLAGKQSWLVLPQGALLSVPFTALVMSGPEHLQANELEATRLRSAKWLGLERALSLLPSLGSLAVLRRAGPARTSAPRAFLGFGDPYLAGDRTDNEPDSPAVSIAAIQSAELRKLDPLPGTRMEIEFLATTLHAAPEDVVLGSAATEAELSRRARSGQLERTRVVVFATHGLTAGSLGNTLQEPALVLSRPARRSDSDDGLLTASEAAQLRFNADWIVLSACNTAASARPDGETLTGLARAFLYAGGRALLVSQWRVEDAAAASLTGATIAQTYAGPYHSHAEALRQSMRRLFDDKSLDERWLSRAHPAVWAPMMFVGADP